MSLRRAQRLTELQNLRSDKPFDADAFGALLKATFGQELPHLTGDPELDIVRVTVEDRQGGESGSLYEVRGFSEGGTRRLLGAFDPKEGGIEVYIAITKRELEASFELFGENNDDIGNQVMLVRVLDLTLAAAMVSGLRMLTNKPYTPELRRLYGWMGFRDGEVLDLDDQESLLRALRYIEKAYDRAARAHTDFKKPW